MSELDKRALYGHDLYTGEETAVPRDVLDETGAVAVQMCKKCGGEGAELSQPCVYFEQGNVVSDIGYGTGVVYGVGAGVEVHFDRGVTVNYTLNGQRREGLQRSLYHGRWEEVFGSVRDHARRKRVEVWVNLHVLGSWLSYDSEDAAEQAAADRPKEFVAVAVPVEMEKKCARCS